MKRSWIKRVSGPQAIKNALHTESRNVVALVHRTVIGAWLIPCARCHRLYDLPRLHLDEVDEGRHVHIVHDGNNPGRQQFLCPPCHAIKTDEGHRDYLKASLPLVRKELERFEAIFIGKLGPELPGRMKHRLEDEYVAFMEARKELYDEYSKRIRWREGG